MDGWIVLLFKTGKRMRSKYLMIFIGVVTLLSVNQTNVLGQNPSNEKTFDSIRREIIIKACNTFKYNNKDVLKIIESKVGYYDALAFHRALNDDSTNKDAKKLAGILGNMPVFKNDLEKNCEKATKYLNQVVNKSNEYGKDISWEAEIRNAIMGLSTNDNVASSNGTGSSEGKKDETKKTSGSAVGSEQATSNDREKSQECGKDKKDRVCNQDNESPVIPIILCVILLLCVGYFIYRKKKNASLDNNVVTTPNNNVETEQKQLVPPQPMKSVDGSLDKRDMMPPQPQESPQVASPDVKEPVPVTKPDCEWVLVGASVKGNGHIQSNMPCQDNHKYESLGNGWGVAVVSDGAGSAEHSEFGSKVVAERGVFHFKNLIEKEGWMKKNVLPPDVEWLQKSYYTLKSIRNEVELVAKKNNVELKSLSATCLVVVYSPIGLLAAHVGDGRMGYKSASGEWRAMMTPHKGEEANQTIFLVSDFWNIPNYVMSGVLVPESIVVREPVKAFALMSDGCENTSWKCTTLNPDTGKYYDQNKPFEGFFNPLEETLLSFQNENVPEEERRAKWYKFIESGTNGFVKEQDDKTMIYGVNVNL
jgi:hypothetical protein